jgi:hypothetical protein
MKKSLAIIKALALVVVAAILGLLVGIALAYVIAFRVPHGEWQLVNLGQEKADRILGATEYDALAVFYDIQTDQGNVYRCHKTDCERLSPGEEAMEGFDQPCDRQPFAVPQPPGAMRDLFIQTWCGSCSGQTSSVILVDGSVWNWETIGCCEVDCLLTLVYPICGLGIGLLTAIAILIIRKRRQRRNDTLTNSSL